MEYFFFNLTRKNFLIKLNFFQSFLRSFFLNTYLNEALIILDRQQKNIYKNGFLNVIDTTNILEAL